MSQRLADRLGAAYRKACRRAPVRLARRHTVQVHPSHRQRNYAVRFDWASSGAAAVAQDVDVVVVVDILTFTTTLTVAVDAGISVLPYRWNDASAQAYARRRDAVLAVPRSCARQGDISLSPTSIDATAPPARVVLPSPNGSTLALEISAKGSSRCVAASLRNATAVGRWINSERAKTVAVVAAGERWPDGSLRPAVEDMWGAGAVLAALGGQRLNLSPEAHAAVATWNAVPASVATALADCASGRELAEMGFLDDVRIAAQVDHSNAVPVLRGDQFEAAHSAST
jgi:2-phosphosulfolactate phosphatase